MVVIGNKGMTETNINARALMLTESQIVGLLGPGSPEEGKEVLAGTVCVCVCVRARAPVHGGRVSGCVSGCACICDAARTGHWSEVWRRHVWPMWAAVASE